MLFCKELLTVTTSGAPASGSVNTVTYNTTRLSQLIVVPTTAINIYDIVITDNDNFEIFRRDAVQGPFNEAVIDIPLIGIYTISIEQSIQSEDFSIKWIAQETQ